MARLLFDIETNGLIKEVTKLWIVTALDIDTMEINTWVGDDFGWKEEFSNATLLLGHNIIGYDFPALEKLTGWKPNKTTNIHDTLLMSQILDYKRFPSGSHSLEAWGESLGFPKVVHEDWSQYSEEMKHRNITDVKLNHKVYVQLIEELRALIEKKPQIKTYLKAEHAVAKWSTEAEIKGWPFNTKQAKILFSEMENELEAARNKLLPLLGSKTVAKDKAKGIVPYKSPKWLKNGLYDAHTCNWFNITPESGLEPLDGEYDSRLVVGLYSRCLFVDLSLDSSDDVKVFLFRNGWIPTEWNYKSEEAENRNSEMRTVRVQTSPKITEDSLEFLGGDGKLYVDFLSTKSRYGVIKTWLENVDENNRLHGSCFTIGTPSMRARHNIIANIPSAEASWGKEIRQLFGVLPGWKFIGADSSGNQARGLAHYLQSEEFIDVLLNKDIHQYNADILTSILIEMGINHIVPRARAKRILYAFLFGASGAKLWGYIFDIQDKTKGNKLKNKFIKAVPGFESLTKKLENIYGKTSQYGQGYIPGIAGNRIYCDSFHKLLVYLLQACEKATCSAALMLTVENLEAEGIPYQPLIMYHDEIDFMVPEEYAERAAVISKKAFKDGPMLFNVMIMDGEAKIGKDWFDCH